MTLRLCLLFFISLFLYFFISFSRIHAGLFTNSKVVISDSQAGKTNVEYNFSFTASGTYAIKQVKIQFCQEGSGDCTVPTGIVTTGASRSGDNLAGGSKVDDVSSNGTLILTMGSTADQVATGIGLTYTGITNPTTINTTSFIRITTYSDTGTTTIDSGNAALAVLASSAITVTIATVPTFSFSIAPAITGNVNGSSITIGGTTTTLIPFGNLASGTSAIAAHDMTVTTNAAHGYQITVKAVADPPMSDSTNNLDKFTGSNDVPTDWTSPTSSTPNTNTGFFGYSTNDTSLSNTGNGTGRFDSGKWAGPNTTAAEAAYNSGTVTSGETIRIGWRSEINDFQPPGSYSGSVILVATPTY